MFRDIEEYEDEEELIKSRNVVADYLEVLDNLFLTFNQEAFSVNYRSSSRIGKSAKRHLLDPSLCCASLGLSAEKLLMDHEISRLLFEALVERDLRIYADYLDGHLYHFKDNISGDEVDAILEFRDRNYAAFEIQLSDGNIHDAIDSLKTFYEYVSRKPAFIYVIVGHCSTVMRDPKTGIFITPLTSLKP